MYFCGCHPDGGIKCDVAEKLDRLATKARAEAEDPVSPSSWGNYTMARYDVRAHEATARRALANRK